MMHVTACSMLKHAHAARRRTAASHAGALALSIGLAGLAVAWAYAMCALIVAA